MRRDGSLPVGVTMTGELFSADPGPQIRLFANLRLPAGETVSLSVGPARGSEIVPPRIT